MYKINFLVSQEIKDEGLSDPVITTKDVAYSESEIEIAACHWKAMGFKKLISVECIPRPNAKGKK